MLAQVALKAHNGHYLCLNSHGQCESLPHDPWPLTHSTSDLDEPTRTLHHHLFVWRRPFTLPTDTLPPHPYPLCLSVCLPGRAVHMSSGRSQESHFVLVKDPTAEVDPRCVAIKEPHHGGFLTCVARISGWMNGGGGWMVGEWMGGWIDKLNRGR